MGMYDTYVGFERNEPIQVQLKAGPCQLDCYKVGDFVEAEDDRLLEGVYLGYHGFVTFKDNIVVGVHGYLKNSNGDCAIKADELLQYNSEFYRYLYGDHVINEKERKVKEAIEKFHKLAAKRRAKYGKNKSKKSKSK